MSFTKVKGRKIVDVYRDERGVETLVLDTGTLIEPGEWEFEVVSGRCEICKTRLPSRIKRVHPTCAEQRREEEAELQAQRDAEMRVAAMIDTPRLAALRKRLRCY